MTEIRRHEFAPSGVREWPGGPERCAACPLPAMNQVHRTGGKDDMDWGREYRRRTGERE